MTQVSRYKVYNPPVQIWIHSNIFNELIEYSTSYFEIGAEKVLDRLKTTIFTTWLILSHNLTWHSLSYNITWHILLHNITWYILSHDIHMKWYLSHFGICLLKAISAHFLSAFIYMTNTSDIFFCTSEIFSRGEGPSLFCMNTK